MIAKVKLLVDQLKRILCQTKPVCLHNTINIGNFLIELSGNMIGHDVIVSMLIMAKGCTVGSILVSLMPTGVT